jgi:S-adenosylmethionine hydrolase
MLGVATFRARILPRWSGLLLIVKSDDNSRRRIASAKTCGGAKTPPATIGCPPLPAFPDGRGCNNGITHPSGPRDISRTVYTVLMRAICFISDYGLSGELVGICKGVMMGIAPGVSIIDVTHSVPEFDVVRGAETLRHATGYMPDGAVYLAVIDPDDKPARRELAAETGSGAYLVGPDNGLLLPAAEALGGVARAVLLTNPEYQLHPVSNSFHGRDIFSPVAAHLAVGADLGDLGEDVAPASLSPIDFPGARKEGGSLAAEIIDIDSFGNARLSATPEDLDLRYGSHVEVSVRDEVMDARYVQTFGSSENGDLVLLTDSHWRLSLAVNKGNAARALLLSPGDEVRIEPRNEPAP